MLQSPKKTEKNERLVCDTQFQFTESESPRKAHVNWLN